MPYRRIVVTQSLGAVASRQTSLQHLKPPTLAWAFHCLPLTSHSNGRPHKSIYIYMYIYIYIYTHTHIYICIYIYMYGYVWQFLRARKRPRGPWQNAACHLPNGSPSSAAPALSARIASHTTEPQSPPPQHYKRIRPTHMTHTLHTCMHTCMHTHIHYIHT